MEQWKTISSQAEREEFLNQIKAEIDSQTSEELGKGLQVIHGVAVQLHKDVFGESSRFNKLSMT